MNTNREFENHQQQLHQECLTEAELDKIRAEKFPNWLKQKVVVNRQLDSKIRILGLGPYKQVRCYKGYDINKYRFHTRSYGANKSTTNSGLCIKGEWYDDSQHDYYGIIDEILELRYRGSNNRVFLFKCHWFDISRGVRIDKEHGLVEIKHTSSLRTYEPFVFAYQAIQVYYLSYPSKKRERKDWWVVMKTKSKGNLGSYLNNAQNSHWFQEEGPICPFTVSTGPNLDLPTESDFVDEPSEMQEVATADDQD